MGRRHNICVHEPPCCYSFRDPGSDSSSELYLPRYKAYVRKKRTLPVSNGPKYYKRKEVLPSSKHCYPCITSHKCTRTSYDRPYPTTIVKGRHKIRHFDETSSDAKSLSGISRCTSALSVDVSCEMAAVNKEIEALLSRYEKTFDDNFTGEVGFKMRIQDKTKGTPKQRRMTNLSQDQLRLLSMERPPLDKLKDIPLEYLKPRVPPHVKQKLLQVQKTLGLTKRGSDKTSMPENNNKDINKNTEPTHNENEVKPSDSATELLKNMWQEMVTHGLVPKNEEVGKTVKQISTSMQLDESSELKIDINNLSMLSKNTAPKAKSTGTSTNSCSRKNSSVATQTLCDYDALLSQKSQTPNHGRGDADQMQTLREEGKKSKQGPLDYTKQSEQKNQSLTQILKSLDEVRPLDKNTSPFNVNNDSERGKNIDLPVKSDLMTTPEQTGLKVFTLQSNTDKFESLKRNFDEWLLHKRNSATEETKSLDNTTRNLDFPAKSDTIVAYNILHHDSFNNFDQSPFSFNFEKDCSESNKTDKYFHSSETLKNQKRETNEQKNLSYLHKSSNQEPKGNGGIQSGINEMLSIATPKPQEPNKLRQPTVYNLKPNVNSELKDGALEKLGVGRKVYNQASSSNNYQKGGKSKFHEPCIPRTQSVDPSKNITSMQKPQTGIHLGINPRFHQTLSPDKSEKETSFDSKEHSKTNSKENQEKVAVNTSNGANCQGVIETLSERLPTDVGPNDPSKSYSKDGEPQLANSKADRTIEQENVNHNSEASNVDESPSSPLIKKEIKKENLDELDSSICVEIIRKLIETMMKSEPGQISDDFCSGAGIMYHLKQLRSDHLKHIQTEVKHIEDLDRCLQDFGISTQLVYTTNYFPSKKK